MKRIVAVVVALVVVLVALWYWRDHRRPASKPVSRGGSAAVDKGGGGAGPATPDPRTLARASIRGVVRERGGGPLAGATVCTHWYAEGVVSEDRREPVCATTDAAGAYLLADLVPASHTLGASAPHHVPRGWRNADGEPDAIELAPGEQRTGVDLVLAPGGVTISGVVEDVSGGPIAGALVALSASRWGFGTTGSVTRADDQGRFTLWAEPGDAHVSASAEGYADGDTDAFAPTTLVHLYLTPESSLSGTVVSADDQHPIAGAIVTIEPDWRERFASTTARSDADGRFRLSRLSPGRYKPTATGDGLYGEPAESVLLGLGQSVDGVIIAVVAASAVRGQIVIDEGGGKTRPCPDGSVDLTDKPRDRDDSGDADADGKVAMTAVLPGHYEVEVRCPDFRSAERYPAVDVVAGKDIDGLVWTVTAGATLTGTVKTAAGAPVAEARVMARPNGGNARMMGAFGYDTTRDDGSFTIAGLAAGDYLIMVSAEGQRMPDLPIEVTLTEGGSAKVDVVLPGGGAVVGSVVDTAGKPVAGAHVYAAGGAMWSFEGGATTDDQGAFTLANVEPGVRRVTASRGLFSGGLRKPGTTDDDKQGETVKVVAGQTATVKLVVEARDGAITGTVKDGSGAPVGDAWLIATRESDAAGMAAGAAMRSSRWSWGRDDRPILTGTDGRFTISDLSRGSYTVRAYRRGGGEAVAEHVALGSDVPLVIQTTGSIEGTVVLTGGGVPDQLDLHLRDPATGFDRDETFFRTGGKFALRELPVGTFVVTADAAGGHAEAEVALAAGEHKTGFTITLAAKLSMKGRFVDLETGAPIKGLRASVAPVRGGGGGFDFGQSPGDDANVSNADGRFVVVDCPSGLVNILGVTPDLMGGSGDYSFASWTAELTGGPELDVGDIPVPKRRLGPGDRRGQLGWSFVRGEPGADPRTRVMKVARVEPGGPAARAGVQVDDVVVAVDGFDVQGVRAALASTLLGVKVGTTVRIGLQRGVTVSLTATADE